MIIISTAIDNAQHDIVARWYPPCEGIPREQLAHARHSAHARLLLLLVRLHLTATSSGARHAVLLLALLLEWLLLCHHTLLALLLLRQAGLQRADGEMLQSWLNLASREPDEQLAHQGAKDA